MIVRNARLCARCAIFFLKIKQISFSCRLAKWFTIWNTVQSYLTMLLELCVVQYAQTNIGLPFNQQNFQFLRL